ncbi:hypothetical protein LZK73_22555 [Neorhizobium galegae]|nr:hypothetical protein LZK73_22555 [Neorhizobium galegae]
MDAEVGDRGSLQRSAENAESADEGCRAGIEDAEAFHARGAVLPFGPAIACQPVDAAVGIAPAIAGVRGGCERRKKGRSDQDRLDAIRDHGETPENMINETLS